MDELLPWQQKNQYQEHLTESGQGTVERHYRWVTGLTYQGLFTSLAGMQRDSHANQ